MEQKENIRPIFVLGCPRSGTTAMGSYVGSAPNVSAMGEYMAYALVHDMGKKMWEDGRPRPFKGEEMRAHLGQSAHEFASTKAREQGAQFYEDDTPINMLVIKDLEKLSPPPAYVTMVRSPAGTIKSLKKSFESGRKWAGATEEDRINLWARFNNELDKLPADRGYVMVYEKFLLHPEAELQKLSTFMASQGVTMTDADKSQFLQQYAGGDRAFFDQDPETGRLSPKQQVRLSAQEDIDASKALVKQYPQLAAPSALIAKTTGVDFSAAPQLGRK